MIQYQKTPPSTNFLSMSNNLQNKIVPALMAQSRAIFVRLLQTDPQHIINYLQRYWFRALVIGFIAFLFFKKDVSVQFSLKNSGLEHPALAAASVLPNSSPQATKSHAKSTALTNTVGVLDAKAVQQEKYVARFAKVAQSEMQKYGIPASITLAQGLLESNAGQSRLAAKNNNHFGIKCFSKKCKKGHCTNFSDDSHKDFFRRYDTAWESYRAHSTLLQKNRYKRLYELDRRDYKGWAKGLLEAGYATDKRYAKKLVRLIEELRLYEYDI